MLLKKVGVLGLVIGTMLFSSVDAEAQSKAKTPPKPGLKKVNDLDLPMPRPAIGEITESEVPEPPPEEPDPEEEPPEFYGEPIPTESSTIFYVCDTSCSMGWDNKSYVDDEGNTANGNRMARAQSELRRGVMSLPKAFKFNIIGYGCSIRRFRNAMVEANGGNKAAAVGFINSMFPSGGTMTGPATAQGLADKENKAVILLTDGAPNCGASGFGGHRAVIRAANTQNAIVTVFGIGATGSLRAFCQGIAADNGGNYVDVP
jgi:hypothetical protein